MMVRRSASSMIMVAGAAACLLDHHDRQKYAAPLLKSRSIGGRPLSKEVNKEMHAPPVSAQFSGI